MNRRSPALGPLAAVAAVAAAACLALAAAPAQAAPVTVHYNGHVKGFEPGFVDLNQVSYDNLFPVGSALSWTVHFDDAFLSQPWQVLFGQPHLAASGSLDIGGFNYSFASMDLFSLQLSNNNDIVSYNFQLNGSGPDLPDGARFFGAWWRFDPQLHLTQDALVGWDYAIPNGNLYAYLVTEGQTVVERGAVPEPAALGLVLLAAAGAAGTGRCRPAPGRAQAARG